MQPKGVGCISEAAVESALAQEWGFPPDLSVREPVIFPWVQPDLEPRLNGTCAEGAVDCRKVASGGQRDRTREMGTPRDNSP